MNDNQRYTIINISVSYENISHDISKDISHDVSRDIIYTHCQQQWTQLVTRCICNNHDMNDWQRYTRPHLAGLMNNHTYNATVALYDIMICSE